MFVINRQKNKEKISFNKVYDRIKTVAKSIKNYESIDFGLVAQKIISNMYSGITTTELDELSARICMGMIFENPLYGDIASLLCINNLHKNTSDCLFETYTRLYNVTDNSGTKFNLVGEYLLTVIKNNLTFLNSIIDYSLDYKLDFFGFKTVEKSYLLKVNSDIIERPQHMYMRVAISIHGDNMEKVEQTYKMMANQYFTHATPTLFNAGTERQQLSSCFLVGMDDTIESIFETAGEVAKISKWAGGIGLSISNVRANGSLIRGTGGNSSGIMPLMKMLNSIATYINQGGKRSGSFAVYLEPHHPDIFSFLEAKKNHGADEQRARDLFYGLWVSDLFMERVKGNLQWSLLCPDVCKGLGDVHGTDFKILYEKYEKDDRYVKKIVQARDVWSAIVSSQIETGGPYILYKDACNKKSNQQNLGTIRSSNLCVAPETFILTDRGQLIISTLKDQSVNVWNGKEFSNTVIVQTNKDAHLIDVSFSDGSTLTCTPYHKFFIQNFLGYTSLVHAKNLKNGMKLVQCKFPIIDTGKELNHAYTIGLQAGSDVFYTSNKFFMYNERYFVPINYSITSKMKWFSGYCDANAEKCLQVSSNNKDFLINIKLMLQTCGVNCNVVELKKKSLLTVGMNELCDIIKLGFKCYAVDMQKYVDTVKRSPLEFVKVLSVVDNNRVDDTFCFNEEKEHKGIFNGVLTSQCAEIVEYSDSSETAVCNLASICLPQFLEEKLNDDYLNTRDGIRLKTSIEKYVDVVVYSKKDCLYCKLLKALFATVGISYTELSEKEDEILSTQFGITSLTVPRVYNHSEYLGGYQEAYKILRPKVNFTKLASVSGMLVENLNNIIDCNFYPTEKTKVSNNRHRPIGIGVQGLADIFILLKLPFDSDEAAVLNKELFETIYYGAMQKSIELSKNTQPYDTYNKSPLSQGLFQFDLWGVKSEELSGLWDWNLLREKVLKYGAKNSLLIALMPTASTSQIMGNNECIEPYTSNLYVRRTMAGEFTVVNKHLVKDLNDIDLWNDTTRNRLIYDRGSVKNIKNMPEFLKDIYKTVWEIKQKKCIDLSADRGPFVCQSQSLNIWLESPTFDSLTSMHFYGWSKGLKTGSYYIRSKPKVNPKNISMNINTEQKMMGDDKECESCSG